MNAHADPGLFTCKDCELPETFAIDTEVVIISAKHEKCRLLFFNVLTDFSGAGKIKYCTVYRKQIAGGNIAFSGLGNPGSIDLQNMIQNVRLSGKIKVAVIGQVHRRIFVSLSQEGEEQVMCVCQRIGD